jgi:uncharacterized damage-inducible protein DinB
MSALKLLRTLFNYQSWANDELLDKMTQIDPELQNEERHAAIRLINHSYVVSQIFASHLVGAKHNFASDNTWNTPDLKHLSVAVGASDRWYLDYLDTATAQLLSETIPFVFTDGDRGRMSREEILTHVVTHTSYHRGEVGRIFAQLAISPPWDTFAVYLHKTEPVRRLRA